MKKKIIIATSFALLLGGGLVFTIKHNAKGANDMLLANVEAMADDESGSQTKAKSIDVQIEEGDPVYSHYGHYMTFSDEACQDMKESYETETTTCIGTGDVQCFAGSSTSYTQEYVTCTCGAKCE